VGDTLRTLEGALAPIVWIGARHADCQRHPHPADILPVRVAADAFGPGAPERDLLLSPDHAVYAEEVLIPVKYLINGTTIVQLGMAAVDYFHIELPEHGVILAEGLPVETYLDLGDRANFGNTEGVVMLHPAFGSERCDPMLRRDALGYAPLHVAGVAVDRLRARIATRFPERRAAG
jgi:hypothetical protein